jgi:SiaC family regulatory phosphoprotein
LIELSSNQPNIFRLSKADNKPLLDFNGETGKFLISGVSNPENAAEFYEPILAWMDEFAKSTTPAITLEIKLDYFSTSSSKWILQIMKRFEGLKTKGIDVRVKWYFHEDDEDLREAGSQYSELVAIPFELIEFKD